jgi:hypothetical protein
MPDDELRKAEEAAWRTIKHRLRLMRDYQLDAVAFFFGMARGNSGDKNLRKRIFSAWLAQLSAVRDEGRRAS